MKSKRLSLLLLLTLAAACSAFFIFDFDSSLTIDGLKANKHDLEVFRDSNFTLAISIYALFYIAVTALSLPGATVMTLAGGAIFGLATGVIIISFASTIGATLAFLLSRFLFKDVVQEKFKTYLESINSGIEKEGAFYLFALRLVPAFPFFVINAVMGLSPMRTSTYFIVSQIGMLPGTVAYTYAGTALSQIESPQDILSTEMLIALSILGLLPLVSKKAIVLLRAKRNS